MWIAITKEPIKNIGNLKLRCQHLRCPFKYNKICSHFQSQNLIKLVLVRSEISARKTQKWRWQSHLYALKYQLASLSTLVYWLQYYERMKRWWFNTTAPCVIYREFSCRFNLLFNLHLCLLSFQWWFFSINNGFRQTRRGN